MTTARSLAVAGVMLLSCASAFEVRVESSLHFDVEAAKNRPVSKVIALLKDMKKQLEQEADEDEEIYEKMACWCETNDKEKTQAISDAQARIEVLENEVLQLVAASARLKTEIKHLEEDIAQNKAALDTAAAMRTKNLAEFNAEEKDLLVSISALKAAIVVLSKHHGGVFLQDLQGKLFQVATVMKHELRKHAALLQGVLTPTQKRRVNSFAQAPEDYFDTESSSSYALSQSSYQPAYAPASGEIFGILKQMKETFEENLSSSQKEELASQKGYEDLKAAKEEEIAAQQKQLDDKVQELATTDEKLANTKQDIEDTKNALSEDEKFLVMLKETCAMTDTEWEARQKERMLEIEAVGKALAILNSDDAHDLFTKTFNPAFLQEERSRHSSRRAAASKLLSDVATKHQNPLLSALAVRCRLDAFTKVKEAIDNMVAQLLKEKQDEIKHKDFCVEGFNDNERETEKKEYEKKDVEGQIADLTETIDSLGQAIVTLKSEILEMTTQVKRASEDREKQNKEFQSTVADQRATQKLLAQALEVLRGFYGIQEASGAHVQKQEAAGPPPPPGFKAYKKNAASGGVMGMIQQIINDAKAMEADALKAEQDSQKAYEDFLKDTNASIEGKNKEIVNKSELKAKAEGDKVQAETEHANLVVELEQLSTENADLHKACDFVMKNFEIRQTARDEEIEALKQAKAILSGAKFSELIQG